jgi:hypothetical protein
MKQSGCLKVIPDAIFFRQLGKGDSGSTELWVTNVAKDPIRVRCFVQPPACFFLSTEGTLTVPSGLDTRLGIMYKGDNSTKLVESHVIIKADDSEIRIPILALPPSSQITPDVPTIDVGKIGLNTTSKFQFTLSNLGVLGGSFQLSCEEESVQLMLTSGHFLPASRSKSRASANRRRSAASTR